MYLGKKLTSSLKSSSDWEAYFFGLVHIDAMPEVCGALKKKGNLHFGFTPNTTKKTNKKNMLRGLKP